MKIFLTGATGYIGNRLACQLAKPENELHLLVRDLNSANLPQGNNIHCFKGDITNAESVVNAMSGCRQVYHCAALTRLDPESKKAIYEVNVSGTQNILEASWKANIEKMVFTSSAGVIGPSFSTPLSENDPRTETYESDYDISKHQAEDLLLTYVKKGLNAVIVNPSRVYGPGPATFSNAMNRMIEYLLTKRFIIFPSIDHYCTNYSYIEDVVEGHILAMRKGIAGEKYILGGENISYGEVQTLIVRYTDSKTRILKFPNGLLKGLAFLSGLINKNTEMTPSILTRFAKHRMVSSQKAVNQLDYHITTFESGIKTTIDFIKKYIYGKD